MKLFIFYLFGMALFFSCVGQVDITKDSKKLFGAGSASFDVTPLSTTMLSGDTIQFTASNGSSPYTGLPYGLGVFANPALEYTAPETTTPTNHSIGIVDSILSEVTASIRIDGLKRGPLMIQPKSWGDQNYPMAFTKSSSGDLFLSSVVGDSPGWERWVTYKSDDTGLTWNKVDEFIEFEEGETHPLGSVNKGDDIYVCGYGWESGGTINSEWFVRKSTDAGTTWNTIDRYNIELGNNVCYDIDVSPATGDIFTVGYAYVTGPGNSGIIRQSSDDGLTWTTIGNIPAIQYFVSVMVSPSGDVWAVGRNDSTGAVELYKGTYAGTWTWNGPYDMGLGTLAIVAYQHGGDLEVESDSVAYFTNRSGTNWKVSKTSDGGLTWTAVYTGAGNTEGVNIDRISTGELIAVGSTYTPSASTVTRVIVSTDNGATWNENLTDGTPKQEGSHLIEANDGSILAVSYNNLNYQIIVYRSTDKGATWSQRSEIYFYQNLWSTVDDLVEGPAGTLYTAGWVGTTDTNAKDAYAVMKSSDNGTTWIERDVFTDAVDDMSSMKVKVGSGGLVYSLGSKGANLILRKSSDSGASWSTVDSFTSAGATYVYNGQLAINPSNGDLYYTGSFNSGTYNPDIRKATSNGTVFSTPVTFPIAAGHTMFQPQDLKFFSDGSLWLIARERDTVPANTMVVYRSTDGAVSWTEVLRRSGSSSGKIEMASDGAVYVMLASKIEKTTNNGTTWSDYYVGEIGSVSDFIISNTDQIFVLTSTDKVGSLSSYLGTWFSSWNMTTATSIPYAYTYNMFNCSLSPYGVCLNVVEDQSILGSANYLYPLASP